MSEQFVIRILSDDFSAGVSGGGGTAGAATGGAKGGGSLAGVAAGIGAMVLGIQQLVSIVSPVINDLLSPIKSILTGIVRMVGELLRPITEMVVFLIRPILVMLQPIISMFRSFMAPFMDIAREYSNMAVQAAASGDIGGAMGMAIKGVEALIGPFIVSITSIALQLATSLVVGAITLLINRIIHISTEMLAIVFGVFSNKIREKGIELQADIYNFGADATKLINDGIIKGTEVLLTTMEKDSREKLETMKTHFATESTSMGINVDNFLKEQGLAVEGAFDESPDSISSQFGTGLGKLETRAKSFAESLNKVADSIKNVSIPSEREHRYPTKYDIVLGGSSPQGLFRF
jgi:hypothetical protein